MLLSGKKGVVFPPGYFDSSFGGNSGQEISTERVLDRIDKVNAMLKEKGVYELLMSDKSKYFIKSDT